MAERRHEATRVHALWRRICAFACRRMCLRVCACMISWLKHPLRIFANPLDVYTLYICQNPPFMSSGTIYVVFSRR